MPNAPVPGPRSLGAPPLPALSGRGCRSELPSSGAPPAGGRAYLVERGLETKPELDALIKDYLQQAAKLNEIPVAQCPLESYLQHIDQDRQE